MARNRGKPANIVRSVRAVARAFGVVDRTVFRWSDDGMPRGDDGTYDLDAIAAWVARRRPESAPTADSADPDRRWREGRADKVQIEVARLRARMVDYELAADAIRRLGSVCQVTVSAWPRKYAELLVGLSRPAEVERVLLEACDELLRSIQSMAQQTIFAGDTDAEKSAEPRKTRHSTKRRRRR